MNKLYRESADVYRNLKVVYTIHNLQYQGIFSPDIVENVWLEPGSNYKQEQFAERRLTPNYKRLPIGEKGIGRFGAHKLGNLIEMTTKSANANEVFVRQR